MQHPPEMERYKAVSASFVTPSSHGKQNAWIGPTRRANILTEMTRLQKKNRSGKFDAVLLESEEKLLLDDYTSAAFTFAATQLPSLYIDFFTFFPFRKIREKSCFQFTSIFFVGNFAKVRNESPA